MCKAYAQFYVSHMWLGTNLGVRFAQRADISPSTSDARLKPATLKLQTTNPEPRLLSRNLLQVTISKKTYYSVYISILW